MVACQGWSGSGAWSDQATKLHNVLKPIGILWFKIRPQKCPIVILRPPLVILKSAPQTWNSQDFVKILDPKKLDFTTKWGNDLSGHGMPPPQKVERESFFWPTHPWGTPLGPWGALSKEGLKRVLSPFLGSLLSI